MKLLRLATVYFEPEPEGWPGWVQEIGRVTVRTRKVNRTDIAHPTTSQGGRLLVAEVALESVPAPGADGLLDIPNAERQVCEHAIEASANLVSVLTRSRRRLASPWPPVALLPESPGETAILESATAFRYSMVSTSNVVPPALKPEPTLLDGLADRLDGVQSVAAFNAEVQPLSRYRETVRFFEMAFARPINAIEKKLGQFLSSGPFGYTRDEVTEWISHRHGATHADIGPSHQVVWDSDVVRFMDRIEQALYDVLLNKKDWHDPSRTRRNLWRPLAGTLDNKGAVFIVEKTDGVKLTCQLLDGFNSFPHDLSANISETPPEWWCKFPKDLSQNRS